MEDFIIDVSKIEELQTIKNRDELDTIFAKAHRTVVGGSAVQLTRKDAEGVANKFDEFTTEEDLAEYKKAVYKYL